MAPKHQTLTDITLRALKPRDKPYKVYDGRGLLVVVQPSGAKLFHLKYRFGNKEKKLSLGQYPEISLREAREARDSARKLVDAGTDPGIARKAERFAQSVSNANTFGTIGLEFIAKCAAEGARPATLDKARWHLSLLQADLRDRPVTTITPQELLAILQRIHQSGRQHTAHRLRSFAAQVFRHAIITARATLNPADVLKGALARPKTTNHAAIVKPAQVGELLRALEGYQGHAATCAALRLAPLVFVRPGELRAAEWNEFDLEKAVWIIPGEKTKTGKAHFVPLSRQAVAILRDMRELSGQGRLVFPSVRSLQRPLSENTLNAALRRLGYTGDEMTTHGYRATASTLLNESRLWHRDAIERALGHKEYDEVRETYDRSLHWQHRVEMAQWWSDYLDGLRDGARLTVAV